MCVKMLLASSILKEGREEFNTKATSKARYFFCWDIFSPIISAVLWWRQKPQRGTPKTWTNKTKSYKEISTTRAEKICVFVLVEQILQKREHKEAQLVTHKWMDGWTDGRIHGHHDIMMWPCAGSTGGTQDSHAQILTWTPPVMHSAMQAPPRYALKTSLLTGIILTSAPLLYEQLVFCFFYELGTPVFHHC